MSRSNKSKSKSKEKDKRLKFQKYFNMGNIFTILDDIWYWICLYGEEIITIILCVSMMAILFGGMIYLLLWSGNTGDGSGSNSGNVSVSSSVSSSIVVSVESSNVDDNIVSNKLDKSNVQ